MSGNPQFVTTLLDNQGVLWLLAVLLYGVGDTVTTLVGLQGEDVAEIGPLALFVMGNAGNVGFVAFKVAFVGICFLVWYFVQTPGRVAIPLALAVVGAAVTSWNLAVIFS